MSQTCRQLRISNETRRAFETENFWIWTSHMKVAHEHSIELYGEDGVRLIASLDAEAMRLRILDGVGGASVVLQLSEAEKVSALLSAELPRRRDLRTPSISFADGEGNYLIVRIDTMGEPYREGVSIRLERPMDAGAGVFLETQEAQRLESFIAAGPPAPAAGPRP